MREAVLFDSDGVWVDTERLFFETTRDAFVDACAAILDAADKEPRHEP